MIKFFLILFFWVSLFKNAEALTVKHYFTAFIGLFNASTAEFEYSLKPNEYSVRSTVRTFGTFGFLYPFEADYFTSGYIRNDKMITQNYHYSSRSRFNQRRKEMIYNDGVPIYALSTKNNQQKKKIIQLPANIEDTTNLQTVLAFIAYQYQNLGFCDSRIPIFDGKKRFDVIFRDEGTEQINANKYLPYSGKAVKCSMYIDKLNAKDDDLLWQLSSDQPIYFWILKDKNSGAPFIAQIKINHTPLGEMNVYTTKIEVHK